MNWNWISLHEVKLDRRFKLATYTVEFAEFEFRVHWHGLCVRMKSWRRFMELELATRAGVLHAAAQQERETWRG